MFASKPKSKSKESKPPTLPQSSTSNSTSTTFPIPTSSRSKRSRDELDSTTSVPLTGVVPQSDDEVVVVNDQEEDDDQPRKKKGRKGKKVERLEEEDLEQDEEPIASTSTSATRATGSRSDIMDVSTPTRKVKKRAKRSAKKARKPLQVEQAQGSSNALLEEEVKDGVAEEADESLEIIVPPVVVPMVDEPLDEVSNLEGLSAAERKAKKGKGKAVAAVEEVKTVVLDTPSKKSKKKTARVEDSTTFKAVTAESSRLEKELSTKNSIINSQFLLLDSIRSTVACTVCLETLDIPYSLRCGHVFCRKCLAQWFHREQAAGVAAAANHDNDSISSSSNEDSFEGSDIVLGDLTTSRGEDDLDASDSESSSSDSSSGSENQGRGMMRATFGNRTLNIIGDPATQDRLWDRAQDFAFSHAARGVNNSAVGARARPGQITEVNSEEVEVVDEETMRNARLARFGVPQGTGVTFSLPQVAIASTSAAVPRAVSSTSTARTPVASTSAAAPAASTSANPAVPPPPPQPQPPVARDPSSIHRHHLDPVAEIPYEHRANQVNLLARMGMLLRSNLVCPQCRDIIDRTPTRIFVLSEMIGLVRQAEKDGVFDIVSGSVGGNIPTKDDEEGDAREKRKKEEQIGANENDTTWGGIFKSAGEKETAKEKRAREARVTRDVEDRVRRCGVCDWEIDEGTGECDHCGRIWDLSSDEDEDLSDGAPMFGNAREGNHNLDDEERSEDEDGPDEYDAEFLDDDLPSGYVDYDSEESEESAARTTPPQVPSKRRGRLVISDTEEEEEENSDSDSSSDSDVIVAGPSNLALPRPEKKKRLNNSKPIGEASTSIVEISDDEGEEDRRRGPSTRTFLQTAIPTSSEVESEEGGTITSAHFARNKNKKKTKTRSKKREETSSSEESSSKEEEKKSKKSVVTKFQKRVITIDDEEEEL